MSSFRTTDTARMAITTFATTTTTAHVVAATSFASTTTTTTTTTPSAPSSTGPSTSSTRAARGLCEFPRRVAGAAAISIFLRGAVSSRPFRRRTRHTFGGTATILLCVPCIVFAAPRSRDKGSLAAVAVCRRGGKGFDAVFGDFDIGRKGFRGCCWCAGLGSVVMMQLG